ncbi:MAG TPA: patatin-like phospholipase family protein, partial [Thermoanaerobaculia bacterium]|nr:patatin-like phospholipase family protein [Thermoanaerobaculia bacterium]
GLLMAVGCATLPRRSAPPLSVTAGRPYGLSPTVRPVIDEQLLKSQAVEILRRARAAATDGTFDILALSGGGAGGAFGAGALVGLSRSGARPQFEIVTGVSAGALIAPFAFLGSAWDASLTEALDGARTGNLLERRTLDVLFQPSLYRGKPLARFVDQIIPDKMIDAVADEAAKGRILLVATTDLDKQAEVIWNIGTIARERDPASKKLFRRVLVASASVPGIFPPVLIHVFGDHTWFDEMHVDGGTTTPFFIAPEIAQILPSQFADLAGAHVYVLMNTQVVGSPETSAGRLGPLVARSFSTILMSMARTELELASAFAREHSMDLRLTAIPVDYPFGGLIDFTPFTMKALFEYGVRCGASGLLWTTPVDALQHAEKALARIAGKTTIGQTAPESVPCPAQ